MGKYQKLATNTALMGMGTFGSKVLVFLMVRFYTGYLGPAEFGTADLIAQASVLLVPLVSFGITDGVFRFAADRDADRDAVFTVGAGAIVVGSLFLALLPIRGETRQEAILLAVLVLSSCWHALCASYVRGIGDAALYAWQGVLYTALFIAWDVLFLAGFHWGIAGYVLSMAAANLMCAAFLLLKVRPRLRRPERGLVRDMLRYSVPLIPTAVFWWVMDVSDRYLVRWFLGGTANGLYAVGYKLPTVLTILSMVVMDAWQLSAIAEARGGRQEHLRFYAKVWTAFQAMMSLGASLVIALCPLLIRLLAAESYREAWRYVPVLALAMVAAAFANFMGSIYVVTGRSKDSLWTVLAGAGANIALDLLLIPSSLGLQGAAIATLAGGGLVFLLRTVNARRLLPFALDGRRLAVTALLLGLQAAAMILRWPGWPLIQAVAVGTILILSVRPLLSVFRVLRNERKESVSCS